MPGHEPLLQAVILDFDGVLADTEPLHFRAMVEALATVGASLTREEYFDRYLGVDDVAGFQAIARDRGLPWSEDTHRTLLAEKASRFREITARERVFFPGVADKLRAWSRSVRLAVASGALRHEIAAALELEGLASVLSTIVASGDTPQSKPAPDPYLRALALLDAGREPGRAPVTASRCVAVEDSMWGIDSARGAGLKVVAVSTSYRPEQLTAADLVVNGFDDLSLDLFETVVGR